MRAPTRSRWPLGGERGLFEPKAVERLLDGHRRGEDRGDQLWNILVLEEWHRAFLDGKEA